jgi:hypothetical protein
VGVARAAEARHSLNLERSRLKEAITMDSERIEFFRRHYGAMSDDRLAVVLASGLDSLSDEAAVAIRDVASRRDLESLIRETNAVVDDHNQQVAANRAERLRVREHNRRGWRAMKLFLLFVLAMFAVMALVRHLGV